MSQTIRFLTKVIIKKQLLRSIL